MIVTCERCRWTFEDEYRLTTCPHQAFLANDGKNNFAIHDDAHLAPPEGEVELHGGVNTLDL